MVGLGFRRPDICQGVRAFVPGHTAVSFNPFKGGGGGRRRRAEPFGVCYVYPPVVLPGLQVLCEAIHGVSRVSSDDKRHSCVSFLEGEQDGDDFPGLVGLGRARDPG